MPNRSTTWFRDALDRYERPLIQYAISITGEREPARDAVQETFIQLSEAEPSRLDGHLAQWLFTVCRNRALDFRRKQNRVIPMNDHHVETCVSADPPPSAALEEKETAGSVARMLDRLPENQREAIRLKFQQDLSYREISDVTGLSVSNVGFLIHCGIKTLRAAWAKETAL